MYPHLQLFRSTRWYQLSTAPTEVAMTESKYLLPTRMVATSILLEARSMLPNLLCSCSGSSWRSLL